ncbi:MAG TPA: trypsin-like peptidase domain-containing protein [Ktedonobacteraceae bacterium]
MALGLVPAAYASQPGGNVADPAIRGVDIAKPAVVRILTEVDSQLTVTFTNGTDVTFPLTAQQGVNGYPLGLSGSGAFISAHGDLLTADHVINPVQDDKQAMDQFLDQTAAPDVAAYINQRSQQQVTANQVEQELASGQLPSKPIYQKAKSQVFLSTDYSGSISATSLQQLPAGQFANVDQIKASSAFSQFDTAIIHVSTMDNMPMLQLGDSSTVQVQDSLSIIGFPGNGDVNAAPNDFLTSSVNLINVSSIKTTPSGAPLIQVGGNVEQGDSGGPALDSNGHIVGIVSFGTSTTGGGTSFLRASSSAKQMMAQAGVDATPSTLQKAWNTAFNDYAATIPGHWHQSMREFQQIATQYLQFKAVSPFLTYASQQAQTEKQTQESTGTPTTSPTTNPTSSAAGLNPVYLLLGGLLVLVILVFGGAILISRRRSAGARKVAAPAQPAYGAPGVAPYFGTSGQGPGTIPATLPGMAQPQFGQGPAPTVPRLPPYPGQMAYPQQNQPSFRPQVPSPVPQPPLVAPQPSFQTQPAAQPRPVSGMAAFGAPPGSLPSTPQMSDSTLAPRSSLLSQQWRIWPCGHTNRADASFCGVCGESSPPVPLVRRVEP